jgi:DNA polymerase elongation subunit (family B)
MIFSPRVGLHENVVVLDYENEYANLILKNNLSYETVTSTHDGRIIRHGKGEPGLLPTVLESVLDRRIFLKDLQKAFAINTNELALLGASNCSTKGYPCLPLRYHWFILE